VPGYLLPWPIFEILPDFILLLAYVFFALFQNGAGFKIRVVIGAAFLFFFMAFARAYFGLQFSMDRAT
jgi:hypothetical protein